jgi:hypothetical protein
LQERIAHYAGTQLQAANELRLELRIDAQDSAELRVYRDDELISLRRFANLPAACADRRDAIALSSALALEGVLQELARQREQQAAQSAREASDSTGQTAAAASAGAAVSSRLAVGARAPAPVDQAESQQPAVRPAASAQRAQPPDQPAQSDSSNAEGAAADGGMRVDLHLGARWLTGALPTWVWVGALGAELWLSQRVLIDLAGYVSSLSNSAVGGARAQAWLGGGELFACTPWALGEFAAEGCLGALAAACQASGRDFPLPRSAATLLWAAGAARLAVRWPERDVLSLRLMLQGHVNMVRPQLETAGSSALLRPGWVGALIGLDMIVTIE